jgi:hypothetical protein
MADIVVKKADETTNVTYNALTPSGGDAGIARWRQDTGAPAGLPAEYRASFYVRTQEHDSGKARKATATYRRPATYQDTTTTLYKSDFALSGKTELIIPKGMTPAEQSEGIRQYCNLLAATLFKQIAEAGYAP